jgi:hypothetical protein
MAGHALLSCFRHPRRQQASGRQPSGAIGGPPQRVAIGGMDHGQHRDAGGDIGWLAWA